jgi:very-short-patch-repair endonuclease
MATQLPDSCRQLLKLQRGVIARRQAAYAGLSVATIDNLIRRGRWQPLGWGTYAAFTGEPPRMALLWAAVLRAGPRAILSHQTAAELDGLRGAGLSALGRPGSRQGDLFHVSVGRHRHLGPIPGMIIHRSERIELARHPGLAPPRTMIEETVLDLAQDALTFDDAIAWVSSACQRGLTTPTLLRIRMDLRTKLRWRAEIIRALVDVCDGAHSALEYRHVRDVERPHRLPRPRRQAKIVRDGCGQFRDALYDEFGLCVELDGLAAHPAEARWRDVRRDNANAADGIITLRYGWADVTERPCEVAGEIARVLRLRGWRGRITPCRPGCPAARP